MLVAGASPLMAVAITWDPSPWLVGQPNYWLVPLPSTLQGLTSKATCRSKDRGEMLGAGRGNAIGPQRVRKTADDPTQDTLRRPYVQTNRL